MDGTLMKMLHGNLHKLSIPSLIALLSYYGSGTLSSLDQSLIRNDLTKSKGISQDVNQPG
jgi:hypothetical protein